MRQPTIAAAEGRLTREELEDKQLDIAAEAREIEKVLARLQGDRPGQGADGRGGQGGRGRRRGHRRAAS